VALFFIAAHMAFIRFTPYLGSGGLAQRAIPVLQPQDLVAVYGDQAYGSSFIFYLRAHGYPQYVKLVNGKSTSMLWGSHYPDVPDVFWSDDDLRRAWDGPSRILLFVPPEKLDDVQAALAGRAMRVVATNSGKTIFSNR
jgi:hypothetical protein